MEEKTLVEMIYIHVIRRGKSGSTHSLIFVVIDLDVLRSVVFTIAFVAQGTANVYMIAF